MTPAMAAGIDSHVRSIEEIVGLLDTTSPVATSLLRGEYLEHSVHKPPLAIKR